MTVRSVMELVLWSLSSSLRGFSVVILAITSHSVSAEYQCHTYPHLWLQHFYMVSSRKFFYRDCDVREMCETRTTEQMSKCGKPRKCSENASKIPEIFLNVISNWYSFILRIEKWLMGLLCLHFHQCKTHLWKRAGVGRLLQFHDWVCF